MGQKHMHTHKKCMGGGVEKKKKKKHGGGFEPTTSSIISETPYQRTIAAVLNIGK